MAFPVGTENPICRMKCVCGHGDSESQTIQTRNKLDLKGDWIITKSMLKQKWAALTDSDLQFVDGKRDELMGRIQERTGETRYR